MQEKSNDLIYRGNAIFEIYRACLKHGISPSVFLIMKSAINNAREISIDEAIKNKEILDGLQEQS